MFRQWFMPIGSGPASGVNFRAITKGVFSGLTVLAVGTAAGMVWFVKAADGKEYFMSGLSTLLLLLSFLVGGFAAGVAGMGKGLAHGAGAGIGLGILAIIISGQLFPEAVSPGGAMVRIAQAAVLSGMGGYAASVFGKRGSRNRPRLAYPYPGTASPKGIIRYKRGRK